MKQLKIIPQITKRECPSLEKYLQEISLIDRIEIDEEIRLAKKIQKNDHEARNKLVEANLRFGVTIAKKFPKCGIALCDLINIVNISLIKAAEKFDHTRGNKYISYAVWWGLQGALQALADISKAVRLPLNRVAARNKINKKSAKLEQEYARQPTIEELAEEVDMSTSEIRSTLQVSKKHVSLDAPFPQGEENNLLDVLKDEEESIADNNLFQESLEKEVHDLIGTLSKRDREIISLCYGVGRPFRMTLQEIGNKFNRTRERIRQVKSKIITTLRKRALQKNLRSYLGN